MPSKATPLRSFSGSLENWIADYLALPESPYLMSIRHAVMLTMPLLLAAAIALLIKHFPLTSYQQFMTDTFGLGWQRPLDLVHLATIEILSLAVAITLGNSIFSIHNQKNPKQTVNPTVGLLAVMSSLIIMSEPNILHKSIQLPWIGLRGLFGNIIITYVAAWLFIIFSSWRSASDAFLTENNDPLLPQVFAGILPTLLTLATILGVDYLLAACGVPSIHTLLYTAIQYPFQGPEADFSMGALYTLLIQICWFLGIHGPDLLDPITHDIFATQMAANTMAYSSNLPIPYLYTKPLLDVFVSIGGSGASLGLICAILLRSRDVSCRKIGYLSLVPGLFNINEIILFGLPIVFNPLFLLPFILVPLLLLTISAFAIGSGLVPPPIFHYSWTTPPILNAFLACNSWQGIILQVVNIGVSTLLYIPFVRASDKQRLIARKESFHELVEASMDDGIKSTHIRDIGLKGAITRTLAKDLASILKNGTQSIKLVYQPYVNSVNKTVPGVKTSLYWHHPVYGVVPPHLIITIADEAQLTQELDAYILQMTFATLKDWSKKNFHTAIYLDLHEHQLIDKTFAALLQSYIASTELSAQKLIFQVPENLSLDPTGKYLPALKAIHATGARIAINDFGKSFQVLSYLTRLPFTDLHIDSALIENLSYNKNSYAIVQAIQNMCQELQMTTTVGYSETPELLDTLLKLRFTNFHEVGLHTPVSARECEIFITSYYQKHSHTSSSA